jgi:hypothetical protein
MLRMMTKHSYINWLLTVASIRTSWNWRWLVTF